ncbi:hypothetical protein [Streptomyces blastmyceticus]|uniref:Uncharacterized protein n=1 Tax=Streptomyces blastmyceticus TaxID=68180 RepID=A0ABN0WL52_9ACTN
MSDKEWRWAYDPNRAHVITGLPEAVVTQVEKIAGDLVDLGELGIDVTDIGEGPSHGGPGGMRRLPLSPDGFVYALPLPGRKLVVITRVIPPFEYL